MRKLLSAAVICSILVASFTLSSLSDGSQEFQQVNTQSNNVVVQSVPDNYTLFHYNGSLAVSYGILIDRDYFHTKTYPSGLNLSVSQKNLDYYDSEDCAHFVSEALIHGGLKALASNPPGDNLTDYLGGFNGSYGIVGVYRLADYLAGYDLPVFPANSTVESIIGYQPIPASYSGSPLASVFYVTNDSILPAYLLWPGDVVMDGGVGNGHAMLYIGNGTVVQTDPAGEWQYVPGADSNITFNYLNQYEGKNVSALYIHIPTFNTEHSVRITAISSSKVIGNDSEAGTVTLIASFPQGVGLGNYTYSWTDNGNFVSGNQVFRIHLQSGINRIELKSTGSNGTAYSNITLMGESGFIIPIFPVLFTLVAAALVASVALVIIIRRRRN